MRKSIMVGISGLCLLISIACMAYYKNITNDKIVNNNEKDRGSEVIENKDGSNKDINSIRITAVGDILTHEDQLKAQLDKSTKEYDFRNNYKYVKSYIEDSDFAIANLETSLSRGERGYSGYPVFITPDAVVDALKYAGFDLLTTANNHIYDGGTKGFFTTQEILKEKNFDYIGTKHSDKEESFVIKDVKGIKIGVANYTYENSNISGVKEINSVKLDKKVEGLIDTFNNKNIKAALTSMGERVKAMRERGAEVVIFYMHWGNEYERQPDKLQKEFAQGLANLGIDIVFASHPHVLQPIEFVKSETKDMETLIVYSLGNFISNQRYERLNQRYSEDGLIVNVEIKKDIENNKISISEVSYIPTWVNRYTKGNNFVYEIVPLNSALKNKQQYNLITEETIWRAENSEKNTMAIIDESSSRMVLAPGP